MAAQHTPQEAFDALIKYCTYQERCHNEVRSKLLQLGMRGMELEHIISRLIELDFLNEERFAKLYAGSKFRQLKWGRVRIKQQLKFRDISPYCIQAALQEIDEESYRITLQEIIEKKAGASPDKKSLYKAAQYAISRGFESDLVWNLIHKED